MTLTALLVFLVFSQVCMGAYLLYSFNDVEREARRRNADLRAHVDRVIADLESRLAERPTVTSQPLPRKQAVG